MSSAQDVSYRSSNIFSALQNLCLVLSANASSNVQQDLVDIFVDVFAPTSGKLRRL